MDNSHRAIVTELMSRGSLWDALRRRDLFKVRSTVTPQTHTYMICTVHTSPPIDNTHLTYCLPLSLPDNNIVLHRY